MRNKFDTAWGFALAGLAGFAALIIGLADTGSAVAGGPKRIVKGAVERGFAVREDLRQQSNLATDKDAQKILFGQRARA